MKELHISEGKNTPEVHWDVDAGVFKITGKSFPENSKKFYNPLTDWLDEQNLTGKLKFEFYFYYLSSSSIIAIYQILKRLESVVDKGAEIDVIWKFDEGDDDIQRIGLDYQKITSLTIEHEMVEED